MRFFRKNPEVWMKGGTSPVSEADYAVDNILRETLLAARPDYGWLSEETADSAARLAARRTFVVDPIDGTRGFLEGQSRWCVCVAVVEDGPPGRRRARMPGARRDFLGAAGRGRVQERRRVWRAPTRRPSSRIAGPKPSDRLLPPSCAARRARIATFRRSPTAWR